LKKRKLSSIIVEEEQNSKKNNFISKFGLLKPDMNAALKRKKLFKR
jgi:hypothetical protein